MPTLRLPALMKFYVADQVEMPVYGASVAEVLCDLVTRYPSIKTHIFDQNGDLRRHINLFVNEANIKDLAGVNTSVLENDRIILLPSISGG
jgi:adenylyltransferase/sulfurtransferase